MQLVTRLFFSTGAAFAMVRGGGSIDEGGGGGSLPPLTPGLEDLLAEKVTIFWVSLYSS